jgi:succinoglycan biosynthesis transport protein ExoP
VGATQMNSSESHSERLPGIRHYLRLLRRRWWVIAICTVVVPVIAFLVSEQQTRLYSANSQVLVNFTDVSSAAASQSRETAFSKDDVTRFLATQAALAKAPAIAQRTVRAAKVKGLTPAELTANTTISLAPGTSVLGIKVINEKPAVAMKLSRLYAEQYIAYRRGIDTGVLKRAATRLTARLKVLRKQHSSRSLYPALVRQRDALSTAAALRNQNSLLVAAASRTTLEQPKTVRNTAVGVAVGLALGLLLALLLDALETRVRSAEEASEMLGLPVLAALPPPPKQFLKSDKLLMVEAPQAHEAEGYRMLRANLAFSDLEHRAHTIMVCSALAQEGKSTTASNLAVAFASTGRSVILVDLDLRRPRLARLFGLSGRPGVTNVSLRQVPVEQGLHTIAIGPRGRAEKQETNGHGGGETLLRVMPSGPLPPGPGEFVGSERVAELLRELTQHADIVLIDSPPLLSVGDAMALGGQVDALLVIARMRTLKRRALAALHTRLQAMPARKLGLALTGAKGHDADYYGYAGTYDAEYYAASAGDPKVATTDAPDPATNG